jgi:hypothetical protein
MKNIPLTTESEIRPSICENCPVASGVQGSEVTEGHLGCHSDVWSKKLELETIQLKAELEQTKREKHQQLMEFCELYKLMPEIENRYPDRLYYHLANFLQRVPLLKAELAQALKDRDEARQWLAERPSEELYQRAVNRNIELCSDRKNWKEFTGKLFERAEHKIWCGAICGPEHESWIESDKCTCGLTELRNEFNKMEGEQK